MWKTIILAQRLCHMTIKVSACTCIFTTAMCKCTIIISIWLDLESFSNFLTKAVSSSFRVDVSVKFYMTVFFKFFSHLRLQTARMLLPTYCCFLPFEPQLVLNDWNPIKLSCNFRVYKGTEFNKTIIPFALIGYENGWNDVAQIKQLGRHCPMHTYRK